MSQNWTMFTLAGVWPGCAGGQGEVGGCRPHRALCAMLRAWDSSNMAWKPPVDLAALWKVD